MWVNVGRKRTFRRTLVYWVFTVLALNIQVVPAAKPLAFTESAVREWIHIVTVESSLLLFAFIDYYCCCWS